FSCSPSLQITTHSLHAALPISMPGGTGDNPLGRIFEEMMGGGRAAQPAPPQPKGNPSSRARTPYDDLFGKMFEAGSNVRDEHERSEEHTSELQSRENLVCRLLL